MMARGDFEEAARSGAPGPVLAESAAQLGLTGVQIAVLVGLGLAVFGGFVASPAGAVAVLVIFVQLAFLAAAVWRIVLILASQTPVSPSSADPTEWPRYTILAALHDEAEVVPHLVEALAQIDYPPDRLEGWLVLEAHDEATQDAALATERPDWLKIMIAPPGAPRTKPRALNLALGHATGDLLTVYDAEDDPDPLQLREAAARFAADPGLGGLQSPLRIRRRHKGPEDSRFLDRQFAVEYASLFEVILPGMARLGLPFPLGGTSNHLRMSALTGCGGWDAHNVTEDADLGFRLWRHGWRLGVIQRPTYETPPGRMDDWLPQRTRWLKGYMQTFGVHTRAPSELGWRGMLSLTMTVGLAVVAALAHAPALAWMGSAILLSIVAGHPPLTPAFSISVLVLGAASSVLACVIGARRAQTPYQAADMVAAPAYWSLLSLAFAHAFVRLITEPHAWDKTRHRPDVASEAGRPPV